MKRKLFFTLIALFAAITSAQALERVYTNFLYYNLDATTQTAEVTYKSYGSSNSSYKSGTLTIPATVTYNGITYSVTGIGNNAFYYCDGLTSVTIPNSVTSIGEGAFSACSNLTAVWISDLASWCAIDFGNSSANPLYYAGKLYLKYNLVTDLTIPDTIETIKNYAFSGCSSLTSVTIPNSVTSIGNSVFYNCRSLTSVTIPNSVTSIGNSAFYNCRSLTSVTIPNSVTSIGNDAFYDVPNIVYSGSVTGVPWGAKSMNGYVDGHLVYSDNTKTRLLACSAAVTGGITIPNSVISIDDNTFEYCSGLTSVTIGNSVTSIGSYAFYECHNLTSVTVSENVNSIGRSAFARCSNLKTIIWNAKKCDDFIDYESTPFFSWESTTIATYGVSSSPAWTSVETIIFGDEVESIPAFLCYGLGISSTINIPNSVTIIGDDAFYGSSSPTVTIGNSVTSIGNSAFSGCRLLTEIAIPNSVTNIGSRAFYNCTDLKKINLYTIIPPSVGDKAFMYYYSGYYSDDFQIKADVNVLCGLEPLYKAQQWGDFTKFNDILLFSVAVESSDTIKGQAYVIQQPTSCDDQTVIIQAVPTQGNRFICWSDGGTENPRTIELTQDTLLKAEFYATGTIEGRCGDNLYWTLTDGTLFITGHGATYEYDEKTCPFRQLADDIRSVSFPADITTIGDYAFYGCKNLTSVTIPQNVTVIGDYSFAECTALERVVIGSGVTSIRCGAFYNDWRIEEITCYPVLVPEVCENSFYNVSNLTYLYVQSDRMRQYQLNPYLKDFDIRPIGATEVNSSTGVTVIPSERDAQFTWPSNSNASSYTLQITKDGEVFCTLVFNEYGQLTGIAFAPARNGEHHPRQAATATTNGWQFTVTGLNEGSAYAYTLDVKDASNQVLNSYNGTFRTEGGTEEPVSWTLSVSSNNVEWGTVTGAGTYEDGTEVVIEAIPATGYRFLYWNDNKTTNPRTILMTADATYTAYFDRITQGTDDLSSDTFAHPCKVIENGNVYILLPDGRKLNMQGAEVK